MTISLILTGGTICCRTERDGIRRCDASGTHTLLEDAFRRQQVTAEDIRFAVQMPVDRLSEDLTPQDWLALLCCIAETDLQKISGMMILHGTDTLDQTAAMLSAALPDIPVPVLLVSAIAPPDHPDSNALTNFTAAVSLIRKGLRPGVWAVYCNADGVTYLHRGYELEQCRHGSVDFFSRHMLPAEDAPLVPRTAQQLRYPYNSSMQPAEVLRLTPYNGLRYDRIPLEGVQAVLHGTYHSETANSAADSPYSVRTLLRRCRENGIPCYLAPCDRETACYGSTAILLAEGAIPLSMQPNLAYAALWVGALRGLAGNELTKFAVRTAKACCEQDGIL